MSARHNSLQDVSNPRGSVDERGCRRDIRSNGWIDLSKGLALERKPVRQKKQVFFVRCGSQRSAISPALAQVKSGPDVFADALVHQGAFAPQAGLIVPGMPSPNPAK
jgi:hypothetical protein